ncbi:hypothetical protein TSOC_005257, partial [Tetrabaena socialis]
DIKCCTNTTASSAYETAAATATAKHQAVAVKHRPAAPPRAHPSSSPLRRRRPTARRYSWKNLRTFSSERVPLIGMLLPLLEALSRLRNAALHMAPYDIGNLRNPRARNCCGTDF